MENIKVAVLTPYVLTQISAFTTIEVIGHALRDADDPRHNLSGRQEFQTDNYQVKLIDSFSNNETLRTGVFSLPSDIDLVLAGSTVDGEVEAAALAQQGHLVARFSIFYGGPSGYTGRQPEQSGYSLDIPKSFETLSNLLQNEPFLEGIQQRDSSLIRDTLAAERIKRPVLVTPYLETALGINRTSH